MFQKLTGSASQISLTALRAFEAMARTGSATAAAAELHVTHSAISRQVKALEHQLGHRLFEGPKHALRLTTRGATLAAELYPAFDRIAAAVTHARGQSDELTIAVHASLSVKWLIPRLPRFHAEYGHINVHLIELPPHAETHRGADIVIRLMDEGGLKSPNTIKLADNAIGPVIAAGLAGRDAASAVDHSPRLFARTQPHSWDQWSSLTGVTLSPQPSPPRSLAHLHFALDAVLSGWGTAVLPWIICADAIADGRLVAPYGFVKEQGGVGLTFTHAGLSGAQNNFVKWIQRQADSTMPAPVKG